MLKKYRKSLIRITSLISSLVILVCCMVFSASAADFDSNSNWVQLLDYSSLNGGIDRSFTIDYSSVIFFDFLSSLHIRYFDILVTSSSDFYYALEVGSEQVILADSVHSKVHDNIYRLRFPADIVTDEFKFSITNKSPGSFDFSFLSIRADLLSTESFLDSGSFTVNNLSLRDFAAGSDTSISWDSADNPSGDQRYSGFIYLDNFSKYDFADIHLMVCASSIDSLSCYLGDSSIPFDVSYLSSSGSSYINYTPGTTIETAAWFDICLRLDFTELDFTSSDRPCIEIRGLTPYDFTNCYLRIISYTGYIVSPVISPTFYFFHDLKAFFVDLFEKTFGSDDGSASNAIQTQEQINANINNQVVGAMQNWESHYSSVSTGADTAYKNAIPALSWLSTLADSVFTNMGWFGNVYFLVGVYSVFLLILSKSGLAHKLSKGGDS